MCSCIETHFLSLILKVNANIFTEFTCISPERMLSFGSWFLLFAAQVSQIHWEFWKSENGRKPMFREGHRKKDKGLKLGREQEKAGRVSSCGQNLKEGMGVGMHLWGYTWYLRLKFLTSIDRIIRIQKIRWQKTGLELSKRNNKLVKSKGWHQVTVTDLPGLQLQTRVEEIREPWTLEHLTQLEMRFLAEAGNRWYCIL